MIFESKFFKFYIIKIMKFNFLKTVFIAATASMFFTNCNSDGFVKTNPNFQKEAANPEFLHRSLETLTHTIKHDIFPPMIAARIYGYASVAAYEALNPQTPQYVSLAGQLNGLPELPKPETGKEYCFPLASVKAFLKVGKKMTFSEDTIDAFSKQILTDFKQLGIPKDVFDRSVAFGDTIGASIIKWSAKDNYAQTRTMPKYTVTPQNPSRWRPTAPDYADALEPHWNKIRPFTLDSAAQFKPVRPPVFDTVPSSKFYKDAFEVCKSVSDSTPERIATAWYWDDNPAATNNIGHVNFVRKKVTPGGHWLHITTYLARQKQLDIYQTSEAYVRVAIGLFDGFISCWDEKYRSEVIRPESYISKYIIKRNQRDWSPIINTPPFPEYTSGHSVVSGASSTILTALFGDNVAFTDSTEVQFGLSSRSFKSFKEAADQAAISRFYAGIHYKPAIEVGLKQGESVADFILKKLKTHK